MPYRPSGPLPICLSSLLPLPNPPTCLSPSCLGPTIFTNGACGGAAETASSRGCAAHAVAAAVLENASESNYYPCLCFLVSGIHQRPHGIAQSARHARTRPGITSIRAGYFEEEGRVKPPTRTVSSWTVFFVSRFERGSTMQELMCRSAASLKAQKVSRLLVARPATVATATAPRCSCFAQNRSCANQTNALESVPQLINKQM